MLPYKFYGCTNRCITEGFDGVMAAEHHELGTTHAGGIYFIYCCCLTGRIKPKLERFS
jgi:hypothetical protein